MLTSEASSALDKIGRSATVDDLCGTIASYLAQRDVHTFCSALIGRDENGGLDVHWLTNAGTDYVAMYVASGETEADYGIRMHATEMRTKPFEIGNAFLNELPRITHQERQFYRDAADFDVQAGLVLPSFTTTPCGILPCGFAIWSREVADSFRNLMAEHVDEISFVLWSAQAKFLPPFVADIGGENVLSPRERECLSYCAAGFRTDAIAEKLCLASVTVHFHLRSARTKLDASTLPEAVAKAVRSGFIVP